MMGGGAAGRASRDGAEGRISGRGPTRAALKDATSGWHAHLERRLPPEAITRSPGAYAGVLAALYGFYAPLEVGLARLPLPIDAAARAKLPALRADLLALGCAPAQLAALPQCPHIPALPGVPEGLGGAYVLEGATLGGRIIARRARKRLGVAAHSGGRFFAGYGARTGERWRDFLAALEVSISARERERAARAAQRTFASLARWLSERGVSS